MHGYELIFCFYVILTAILTILFINNQSNSIDDNDEEL